MNCTFDKMLVSITFPDYLYCGFTQTFLDDFNWKLGNSETPTAGTGPIEDHTGNNKGMFCIMACMHYTVITNSNVSRSAFKCISVLNGGGVSLGRVVQANLQITSSQVWSALDRLGDLPYTLFFI